MSVIEIRIQQVEWKITRLKGIREIITVVLIIKLHIKLIRLVQGNTNDVNFYPHEQKMPRDEIRIDRAVLNKE